MGNATFAEFCTGIVAYINQPARAEEFIEMIFGVAVNGLYFTLFAPAYGTVNMSLFRSVRGRAPERKHSRRNGAKIWWL